MFAASASLIMLSSAASAGAIPRWRNSRSFVPSIRSSTSGWLFWSVGRNRVIPSPDTSSPALPALITVTDCVV